MDKVMLYKKNNRTKQIQAKNNKTISELKKSNA